MVLTLAFSTEAEEHSLKSEGEEERSTARKSHSETLPGRQEGEKTDRLPRGRYRLEPDKQSSCQWAASIAADRLHRLRLCGLEQIHIFYRVKHV